MGSAIAALILTLLFPSPASAQEALLYASFDGTATASRRSDSQPNVHNHPFPRPEVPYDKGIRGKAAVLGQGPLRGHCVVYPLSGSLDPSRGALLVWVRKLGTDQRTDARAVPVSENLVPRQAEKLLGPTLSDGKWHQLATSWDTQAGTQTLYLDAETIDSWRRREPIAGRVITFGESCPCLLDELVIVDSPLESAGIEDAFQRGRSGKSWLPGRKSPRGREPRYPLRRAPEPAGAQAPPEEWRKLGRPRQSANGVRQRYSLGGTWRARPVLPGGELPAPEHGLFVRAPGQWRGPETSFINPTGLPVAMAPSVFAEVGAVWLERTFPRPQSDGKRRYRLVTEAIQCRGEGDYPSDLYLNGTLLGTLHDWERGSFEVTDLMKRGAPNVIQILNGRPWASVEAAGLVGDVWLEVCPDSPTLIDEPIFVRSGVSEQLLGVEFALSGRKVPRDYALYCRVEGEDGTARDELLGPAPLKSEEDGGLLSVWLRWPGARAWTAETPHLSRLSLLIRKGDEIIDESFSVRFGFRELALSKDALLLNGHRLHLRANTVSPSRLESGGLIRQDQSLGFNAASLTEPSMGWAEQILSQADELGHYVLYPLGPTPKAFLSGLNVEHASRYFAARMERLANHPSLLLWQIEDDGFVNGPHGHPLTLGSEVEPRKDDPAWQVSSMLHEIDPSRPNSFARLGVGGHVRSLFQPFGPDVPLQSQEEWPRAWTMARREPLLLCGNGPMPARHFFLWQRGPERSQPAFVEHAARYFGDAVYRKVSEADTRSLLRTEPYLKDYWDRHPVYDDLRAFAAERLITSWRAFGMSYVFQTQRTHSSALLEDSSPALAKALARYNNPITAYLTGPAENFLAKDHAYFSGEAIEKQVVLVNDSSHTVAAKVQIEWSSTLGVRHTGQKDSRTATLGPGQTVGIPVALDAPAVTDKTPLELAIEAVFLGVDSALRPPPIQASASFRIFPRFRLPRKLRAQRILVADPEGTLSKVLEQEEVPFSRLTKESHLGTFDLLVLGRSAADPATMALLDELELAEAVENGLNLLCFEQPFSEVFGLRVETFDSRRAFIRSPDSPLLQGLTDADLADWRGEASLKPPYPGFDPDADWRAESYLKHGCPNALGQRRSWHWSNLGTVATFCFRKPQRGSFRVLLDCGFDLLYTPLLEVRMGLGRMLFCQLDVTGRYGVDPVATLLVQRMLAQYAYREETGLRTAMAAVGEPGRKLLSELGVPAEDFAEVSDEDFDVTRPLVVDLRQREALTRSEMLRIQDFVARGGKLLQIGASSPQDKPWLPGDMRFQRRNISRTEVPVVLELSGLGDSDLFWRQPQVLPAVTEVPPRGTMLGSGALAIVPFGRGRSVFCQFDPLLFNDPWQRTKAFRVISTLLTNLGARSVARPWPSGEEEADRPGLYVEDALDFDPDEHYLFESR